MYKVLRPDRDAYITDRVIKSARVENANVGAAGSLDLFKLYDYTQSGSNPNIELSRLLIHFDLDPLRELVADGKLDPSQSSFNCTLKLFDVFGGQPTPANFTVVVHPLSRSFDEGLGRDVVYYTDRDVCNFLTGSRAQGPWLLSGCALGGGLPGSVDYITASTSVNAGASLESSQLFTTGEEDLEVNVTLAVSATLAGILPDRGFRIALDDTHETDQRSYFVKRFASRIAYNEAKRPRLIVRYDDSIQDDSAAMFFDSPSSLFLFNYVRQAPANITSGTLLTPITGTNSLILKLQTAISGGWYTTIFTGSQHKLGIFGQAGIYSASVNLQSSNSTFAAKLAVSSSVKFIPIWGSLDGTVSYITGSPIAVFPPQRGGNTINKNRYIVTVQGLQETYPSDENTTLRVNLFDVTEPSIQLVRLPAELPGAVVRDVHWQVRDSVNGVIEIPFDETYNSTRVSSDASGMFFSLDMSNLTAERSYVIDILVAAGSNRQVYKNVSPVFRVSDLR